MRMPENARGGVRHRQHLVGLAIAVGDLEQKSRHYPQHQRQERAQKMMQSTHGWRNLPTDYLAGRPATIPPVS